MGVAISTRHQFACRHFVALVLLFQGVACWNLPLSGPYRRVGLGGGGGGGIEQM